MSATTIQIPADHVEAIRTSLRDRRGDAGDEAREVERLLAQFASAMPADAARDREVTGSRSVLWTAVYDVLCAAAEQLAEDCNDYCRGAVAPDSARAAVARVGTSLELLIALGAPPGR